MKVIDAMYLIVSIHSERNAIEAFVAHNTCETTWMVWFASCTQNALQDRFLTYATFLQSVLF